MAVEAGSDLGRHGVGVTEAKHGPQVFHRHGTGAGKANALGLSRQGAVALHVVLGYNTQLVAQNSQQDSAWPRNTGRRGMATEAAADSGARSRKPEASKKFQGKHLADAENKNLWGVTQHWIHGHCWRPHGPGGELRIRHPH